MGWRHGGIKADTALSTCAHAKSPVAMLYCLDRARTCGAVSSCHEADANDPSKVNVTEVKAKEKPAQATSADSDKKDSASAARPEDSVDAFEDAVQVINTSPR